MPDCAGSVNIPKVTISAGQSRNWESLSETSAMSCVPCATSWPPSSRPRLRRRHRGGRHRHHRGPGQRPRHGGPRAALVELVPTARAGVTARYVVHAGELRIDVGDDSPPRRCVNGPAKLIA